MKYLLTLSLLLAVQTLCSNSQAGIREKFFSPEEILKSDCKKAGAACVQCSNGYATQFGFDNAKAYIFNGDINGQRVVLLSKKPGRGLYILDRKYTCDKASVFKIDENQQVDNCTGETLFDESYYAIKTRHGQFQPWGKTIEISAGRVWPDSASKKWRGFHSEGTFFFNPNDCR